jgi:hypothetical protein
MKKPRIWVLGAADHEMAAIETLLRSCGETVVYATVDGVRCHAGNAYRAECTWHDPAPNDDPWEKIYTVECCPTTRVTHRIDHHRPGDTGWGIQPERFLAGSSLGQVISELARLGVLPEEWHEVVIEERVPVGMLRVCDGGRWYMCISYRFCGRLDDQLRGTPEHTSVLARIPLPLVLTAAADHCLGAAYAGRCHGVDPAELRRHRIEAKARERRKSCPLCGGSGHCENGATAEPSACDCLDSYRYAVAEDIRRACAAIESAPRISLAVSRGLSGQCDDGHPLCSGCGDCVCQCPHVADMRSAGHTPELPEAACILGQAFVAQGLPGPDGRTKIVLQCAQPEHLFAWRDWAEREGLVDLYGGDPARGFAGGYLPSSSVNRPEAGER